MIAVTTKRYARTERGCKAPARRGGSGAARFTEPGNWLCESRTHLNAFPTQTIKSIFSHHFLKTVIKTLRPEQFKDFKTRLSNSLKTLKNRPDFAS